MPVLDVEHAIVEIAHNVSFRRYQGPTLIHQMAPPLSECKRHSLVFATDLSHIFVTGGVAQLIVHM
eukprot:CAMPEP_0205912160 /NCGR_PEP_ID=MMETSP1325-20131115/5647_1 /ASSEMBLY_ACC=CAM_ASM_000708 /TAXON_ID=236786 /ORGANISM="Florenciella sp., Strain RCC1007" /LENGTH=65 /DNA_ID=CAMNT_0053278807 /DNA_START=19 /DNA_END=216 /DNA_ORIENTATION=-